MKKKRDDAKGFRFTKNLNLMIIILELLIGTFIVGLGGFVFDIYKFWWEKKNSDNQIKEKELKKQPEFKATMEKSILLDGSKYQRIYLINKNDEADIVNGEFCLEYMVSISDEEELKQNYFCDQLLYEQATEYDEDIDGGLFFLNSKYKDYRGKIREDWVEKNDFEDEDLLTTYVFFYFTYMESGEEKSNYYLLEIKDEKCKSVRPVFDYQKYTIGIDYVLKDNKFTGC